MLDILRVPCGLYEENAYIVSLPGSRDAIVIDPGDDYPALVKALAEHEKTLKAVCLTHAHFDHMLAAPGLIADTGAALYVGARDLPALNDEALNLYKPEVSRLPAPKGLSGIAYGRTLVVCGIEFQVLLTPGHTPGGISLYAREYATLFSGDTLFLGAFGRVDFPGSSAREMRASLNMLFSLPGDTRVYPGHGGSTTIARERGRYRA
jgi:hydroxyacylglutathione hydrolase